MLYIITVDDIMCGIFFVIHKAGMYHQSSQRKFNCQIISSLRTKRGWFRSPNLVALPHFEQITRTKMTGCPRGPG